MNLNVLHEDTKIDCIAKSLEKFTVLKIGHVHIKDSLQFLNTSLDTLVSNLKKYGESRKQPLSQTFKYTYEYFKENWPQLDEKYFEKLTRKGVYPYEYITSHSILEKTELPPKEKFDSELTRSGISDKDYRFVQEMWVKLGMTKLKDLHDIYMAVDVCLLADVFETFWDNILQKYKLDPAHFTTAPSLTWTAGLKVTGVELDLLTDVDMSMFIDKSLLGGVSMVAHPHAHSKFGFIFYCDANNLYGWSMIEYLPKGGFKWVDPEAFDWDTKIRNLDDAMGKGYFLEVDLEYPQDLHGKHNNFPCAPEKIKINMDELSPHQKELKEKIKAGPATEKLVLTLKNKTNYILHHRNLKQYLELGLELKKVHRVLEFNQSPWLKKYIELNTYFRQQANNKFEKDLYKLMNNAFFGKTCEDVRKYSDVKIINNDKTIDRLSCKETFSKWQRYDENLAAFLMNKNKVKLNKPRYVGAAILALSKTVMYGFHYQYMMEKFPNNKLLFTDTDSFCYSIPGVSKDDFYAEIKTSDYFDRSNYSQESGMFCAKNKMVPGKFKDECPDMPIEEFVGLRAKMYSLKLGEGFNKATAKGVGRLVRGEITHEDYYNSLFENKEFFHKDVKIDHEKHQLVHKHFIKKSLSPYNDKKWIQKTGNDFISYSFGHKAIPK